MREAFHRADKNRDGTLDIGEVNAIFREMEAILNPDELFKIVAEIDKDQSGRINYDEFLNFFAKRQGVSFDSSDSDWD